MNTIENELTEALAKTLSDRDALPYLFVGSGLSRRYLDLPDWSGLLKIFSDELGENFDQIRVTANGNLPTIASNIASEFNEYWWNSPLYEKDRTEWASKLSSKEDALKVSIASYFKENQELVPGKPGNDDQDLSTEVSLLKDSVIDGVITTNYDNFVESMFPSLKKYVGQEELLFGDAQFISEIYKIHGSFDDPFSMLVTEEDYSQFTERNKYLAAKLLTIFAEHPIIFVGYSLNDEYLTNILDDIVTAVGPERADELGKQIIFIEWNRDPTFTPLIESSSIYRGERRSIRLPITRIETNTFGWIWKSLHDLKRPFPATLLRELRHHVYNLVTHPDPSQSMESVRVLPMDAEEAKEVSVVFGVARFTQKDLDDLNSISARAFDFEDLRDDILETRPRPLDAENVLTVIIPDIIRPKKNNYTPVYKYLSEINRISPSGSIDFSELDPVIEVATKRTIEISESIESRFNKEVRGIYKLPSEIFTSDFPVYFMIDAMILLEQGSYPLEDLRDTLVRLNENFPTSGSNGTLFKKLLCHYDRIRHLGSSPITIKK